MLTRRHIRVKVMQQVYALNKSQNDNVEAEEKNLLTSIDKIYDLFALQLNLLVEVRRMAERRVEQRRQKMLASKEDLNPNTRFVDNSILLLLEDNVALRRYSDDRSISWKDNDEFVSMIYREITDSEYYGQYQAARNPGFHGDKNFILDIFAKVIAPNEKLHDLYEDKNMSWVADLPVANSMVMKALSSFDTESDAYTALPRLYKDGEDRIFAQDLYRKTVLNQDKWQTLIQDRTNNWEPDRIAAIDFILMEMGLTEFTKFPSVPTKVSLNEYIEISKDYSTRKSKVFINGILDKLLHELHEKGEIRKSGRGLM